MAIISGLGPLAPVQLVQLPVRLPARGKPGGLFKLPDAARAEGSTGVLAVATPSLLALQEEESNDVADREARRHGHAMLAALADLQYSLLGGGRGGTAQLAALARAAPSAADPRLAAIQKAIQVRVAVELARARAASRAAASV